jgi:hypothetical protein
MTFAMTLVIAYLFLLCRLVLDSKRSFPINHICCLFACYLVVGIRSVIDGLWVIHYSQEIFECNQKLEEVQARR